MSKLFYPKLALSNIKNNVRLFMPYILMNIGIIMMFYIMHAISVNKGLDQMSGSDALKMILTFGTYVIGIFSAIFIFYTNSFLVKRRKKEIGLYNILGMGKRHLAIMLFLETIFIAFICIGLGLLSGIIFSKFMYLVFLKILGFSVALKFSISITSVALTTLFFGIVFLVTLAFNLGHIHLSNPIELLKGSSVGEREPKTKWIMTILGFVSLLSGYYIALSVKAPLQALTSFFIAVVLVMIGTYYLFTAGSIALLKLLKKNSKFYYKSNNFTSVSGMIYRMKQNAVGLANICILSTAVLVTLSTTLSLYMGLDDVLKDRYPQAVTINSNDVTEANLNAIDEIIAMKAKEFSVDIKNSSSYTKLSLLALRTNNDFKYTENFSYSEDQVFISLLSIEDYNQMAGEDIVLESDEVYLFSNSKDYGLTEINLGSEHLNIRKELSEMGEIKKKEIVISNDLIIFVKDLDTATALYEKIVGDATDVAAYSISFDTVGDPDALYDFDEALFNAIERNASESYVDSRLLSKESFFSLYGGFFFIGLFLGTLFLMATVMIIYYKQVSEGYDDKGRFEIMQKVGMSIKEIKKTIKTQIIMVFFLPLLFAVVHIGFAFNVITRLLAIFNFTNIPLFFLCTVGTIFAFALIYFTVFFITARAYYKIVK